MSAPFKRHYATARSGSAGASGMRMALDCARSIYEAVDRRMPEAAALAAWLGQSAAAFGLPDTAIPDDEAPRRSRRRGVPAPDWRKIGSALAAAEATLPGNANTPADRWIEAIAETLALDPLEARILSLALHYKLDQRVERLFDATSECRGGATRFHRGAGLIALLLQATPAEIEMRLRGDAKLLASGLLRLDQDGELHALERLVSLIRQDAPPAADFYDQLLGAIVADPLPWESFAHLGREAEVVAAVLRAALAGRESGINILLYGPPGTGKTSFAATLAARTGARLRPVAEADDFGGEPARHERLAGLRLAQRLAAPGNTLLLFDEAEDLFVTRSGAGFGEPATSSRVFIHRLLERMAVPVIWTANDIGALGPAVLRRMTMCLELKIPNLVTRTRLWRRMGDTEGVVLPEADAARLARLVPAAPAVASAALRATRLAGGGRGDGAADRGRCRAGGARRQPAGARAGARRRLRPGTGQRRLRSRGVDGGPAAPRGAPRRLLPAVRAARRGQKRLGAPSCGADGPAGAAQTRLGSARSVRWRHRAEHRRRLCGGAGHPCLPGVRRGGQPVVGAGLRGARLGDQPSQRNADLDGAARAAFCLHHQSGWPAGSRQSAPVSGQAAFRLDDQGAGAAGLPALFRHGRASGPGRAAHADAGGFFPGAPPCGVDGQQAGPGHAAAPARRRVRRPDRRAAADGLRCWHGRMIAMAARGWQHRAMRYEPSQRLLRLARHLAASRAGLTLDEMAAELEVGRRTAERLRDSLAAMFPQMECWDDDERVRRWRLPGSALVGVVEPRPEAVAAIEISARECAMRGEADRAALLREASTTLRAVMRPDALRRAEPDIAALMEAEGIAMRPGPRPMIAAGVLPTLRRAILGMQLVVVRYAGRDAEKPATRILCPYGILYGGRGWLVAHVDELPEMRLWRLDRIVSIDLLDRGFAAPRGLRSRGLCGAVVRGIPGGADRRGAAVRAGGGG